MRSKLILTVLILISGIASFIYSQRWPLFADCHGEHSEGSICTKYPVQNYQWTQCQRSPWRSAKEQKITIYELLSSERDVPASDGKIWNATMMHWQHTSLENSENLINCLHILCKLEPEHKLHRLYAESLARGLVPTESAE